MASALEPIVGVPDPTSPDGDRRPARLGDRGRRRGPDRESESTDRARRAGLGWRPRPPRSRWSGFVVLAVAGGWPWRRCPCSAATATSPSSRARPSRSATVPATPNPTDEPTPRPTPKPTPKPTPTPRPDSEADAKAHAGADAGGSGRGGPTCAIRSSTCRAVWGRAATRRRASSPRSRSKVDDGWSTATNGERLVVLARDEGFMTFASAADLRGVPANQEDSAREFIDGVAARKAPGRSRAPPGSASTSSRAGPWT